MSTVATCAGTQVLEQHMNTQIVGAAHHDKYQAFKVLAERWRLAYMSVTIYQDAPALANQGTIVSAQHAVQPAFYAATQLVPLPPGPTDHSIGYPRISVLKSSDHPQYDTLQSMPNAYFNRSQEGAYIPLKLTKTCQQWHGENDEMLFGTVTFLNANMGCVGYPDATYSDVAPFFNSEAFWLDNVAHYAGGTVTSNYCNDVWSTFALHNLAPTTSLSFFVRAGYELMVQPGTALTSHQVLSPKHDPVALSTYFAISRELKDAYPADYNTTGKILSTISNIARTAAPFLSAVPGFGAALAPAAMGLSALTGGLDKLFSKKKNPISSGELGRQRSLADIQREVQSRSQARRSAWNSLMMNAQLAARQQRKVPQPKKLKGRRRN